jgi:hypothetical protein
MTKPAIERIEVSRDELNQLLERAKTALHEDDYRKLKATVDALSYLTELVADRERRSGTCASCCCHRRPRRHARS